MHGIEGQVRGLPVQFVSFTVDPDHDTPDVLKDYAEKYHAIGTLAFPHRNSRRPQSDFRYSFKLGTVDGTMVHSTRFTLVDGQQQIRGYYSTDDPDSLKKLVRDLRELERDRRVRY